MSKLGCGQCTQQMVCAGPTIRRSLAPQTRCATRKIFCCTGVWEDERGFHMLSHGHFDENGYYAFSTHPEGPWYFRHQPTYTNVLVLSNGSSVKMKQRERPQIFFNESTGRPALLFTGVAPPGSKFYGYTYTHAQKIRQ